MTRDEAILILVTSKFTAVSGRKYDEVVDMAIEALQTEVVRCKDCRHANECHKNVQYTHNEQNMVTIGYTPIEWCSKGEKRDE